MINLEQMLDSGVHLGHQVRRWNPKMSPYIYGKRNGIHIIDILQTFICLDEVSNFLYKIGKENKTILFICTKSQFSSIIEESAKKSNSFFVNKRWLGGMLTNWSTMKLCIKNLKELTEQQESGALQRLTKKEASLLKKKKDKLNKYFSGVKKMERLPDVAIIVDQQREINAVKECIKLKIPMITLLDTNCDPTLTDYFVLANDDSLRSVTLILDELTSYILAGRNQMKSKRIEDFN